MAPPRIVRSDSQEREFQRQRLERSRQYRKDPQVRARDAERKRLKRQADRELRNREARAKRAKRLGKRRPTDGELRGSEVDASRARRTADPSYEPTERTIRVRRKGSSRANSSELCTYVDLGSKKKSGFFTFAFPLPFARTELYAGEPPDEFKTSPVPFFSTFCSNHSLTHSLSCLFSGVRIGY